MHKLLNNMIISENIRQLKMKIIILPEKLEDYVIFKLKLLKIETHYNYNVKKLKQCKVTYIYKFITYSMNHIINLA